LKPLCEEEVGYRLRELEMRDTRRRFQDEWHKTMARWVPERERMKPEPFYQVAWIAFLAGRRSQHEN
jgi:hypothetical protein